MKAPCQAGAVASAEKRAIEPTLRRRSKPGVCCSAMEAAAPPVSCPACGCAAVIVEPAKHSACLPFPPVEPLRCPACGNTGTRLRLHDRTLVQWARKG